jgi:regulator of protease activity HflC (stomatin/prohibitin superfamily)
MLWLKWGLLGVSALAWLALVVVLVQRWRKVSVRRLGAEAGALAAFGAATWALHYSVVIVPSGTAGIRVSQFSGTRSGTLFPGAHWIHPVVERVVLYDTREKILSHEAGALAAQSKEGLSVGLAVNVRYRIEPKRLDHIHASLPQPVEQELVPPIVASAFRQVLPNYMVREIFATRREEVRQTAARIITDKLMEDGIVVKEVMLRDIVLPHEYARGLEGLLLKEQENERMVYDLQVKEKQVRAAALEAEAVKARQVKKAEADAETRVLQAKAEADAMQHTLPLKEKQIQQSRLEAEARKETTLKNAEADAQARLIESRAEQERSKLMSEADALRIRVIASADAERLGQESAIFQRNPLLIQKIVAERLSDKMQIMMVPMDGKDFFATDVFRAASMMGASVNAPAAVKPAPAEETPRKPRNARR